VTWKTTLKEQGPKIYTIWGSYVLYEMRILDRLRMKKDIDENKSYEKCNVFGKKKSK
jgi:hypothetical protein